MARGQQGGGRNGKTSFLLRCINCSKQVFQVPIVLTLWNNFKTPNDLTRLELSLLFATSLVAPKIEETEEG